MMSSEPRRPGNEQSLTEEQKGGTLSTVHLTVLNRSQTRLRMVERRWRRVRPGD